jgi:hypothetical protein
MQGVMSLRKDQIRFTDDEQVYTDFLTAAHMLFNLYSTWNVNRREFLSPDRDRYLGELQFLLSRALDVVREKRNMLVVIANSVFVNPADLANFYLDLPSGKLTFAEILSAVDDAVTKTPGMLKQGGLWAVMAIGDILEKLLVLVAEAVALVLAGGLMPEGCRTDRFRTALNELRISLEVARDRVLKFPRPRMSISNPRAF